MFSLISHLCTFQPALASNRLSRLVSNQTHSSLPKVDPLYCVRSGVTWQGPPEDTSQRKSCRDEVTTTTTTATSWSSKFSSTLAPSDVLSLHSPKKNSTRLATVSKPFHQQRQIKHGIKHQVEEKIEKKPQKKKLND